MCFGFARRQQTHQIPDVEEDVAAKNTREGLRHPLPQVHLDVGEVLEVLSLPVPLGLFIQLVPGRRFKGTQTSRIWVW